jgi:hypothetical protein
VTNTAYNKPLPSPSPITQGFWAAAHRHEFLLQRCRNCRRYIHYPRAACPHCLSQDLEWAPASGRGAIYSYTVARRPTASVFADMTPYVIAIVELEEGPRMTTNIVGCPPEEVRIGMPVEVVFDDVTDEVTLVKFRPRG